jgi:hypothetical protein
LKSGRFATMDDTGEIYYYDLHAGTYIPGGEILIETEAEEFENRISTCKVNEIVSKIRRRTYVSRSKFDKDSNLLHLRNGLLNIMTGELVEHNPMYLSLVELPHRRHHNPILLPFLFNECFLL